MAVAGLPRYASRLPVDNPLLEDVVRSGVVDLFPAVDVPSWCIHVGEAFVWWRPSGGRSKLLCRVVGAAPCGLLPARLVLVVWVGDRQHEVVVFASEVELWLPPRRGPGAGRRLRQLVGDPLR